MSRRYALAASIVVIFASAIPGLDPGTVLQGLEDAFRAAARLRRIGRDMLDAQMIEGAADLRQAGPIHLSASLRRVKVVAAPIRVEAQRQAMPAEHLLQGPECRGRTLLLHQKGRENRARRIVHRDNQIKRRLAAKPSVPRAS